MLPALLGSFAVLLVLRVPVAAAMGLSGAFAVLTSDMGLPLAVVPQRIFVLLDSTSLLAIPFFILAGAIMEQGGMARRMIDFAQTMVGHWRGGLAQVDVLASTIFSSLTGSSAASASARTAHTPERSCTADSAWCMTCPMDIDNETHRATQS